ncbi:beta-ketoacyl synthase N-terminal-like domain-containing protein [Streptomyces sp. NPDC046866]|uniref:beta-ketoacyl [acyl carrier protein] synthase domain-containing protein n=1 Tax=Streptomyces sp. NPDC046866 TaxID=3154921 RepID=UPI00345344EF
MDEKEILTRFRNGTLTRAQTTALLAGVTPAPGPAPEPGVDAGAASSPGPGPAPGGPGPGRGAAGGPRLHYGSGEPASEPGLGPGAGFEAGFGSATDAGPGARGGAVPGEGLAPGPASGPLGLAPSSDPGPGGRTGPGAGPDGGRGSPAGAVAVVGMAGRQPRCGDLEGVWRQAEGGGSTASGPPGGRGGNVVGHYLDRVQDFDAAFFGIEPAEAALVDPQERLFLETAWEALEDAGCTGSRLDALRDADGTPRSVGVFAGAGPGDYALLAAESWGRGHRRRLPRGGSWNLSNRVSGLLRLTGPSVSIDTAESSALVALHQALSALRRGECAAALVGGVQLLLHASNRRPGAGEAVGALVLKPLERALADGDTVHCLIRGSAVGHEGAARRNAGPAGRIARAALREAGADPAGSGGLLREDADSVAAAVGAAGAATGVAVLLRAALQLRHGVLLPAAGRPAAAPWPVPPGGVRRASAGVRGAGGVEAHVVLEEYVAPPGATTGRRSGRSAELVVLSAPTPAHLAATARRFAGFLAAPGPQPDLAALAASLRTGRAAMDCRYAAVVGDTGRLARVLADLDPADGRHPDCADLRHGAADPHRLGEVPETRAYLAALWSGRRLDQLKRLWLSGVDVDWAALEGAQGQRPVAVPLPASAFLRTPLWLDASGETPETAENAETPETTGTRDASRS